MTDAGRKDFTTKAKEEIIPDSSKSGTDRAKESLTDTGDKIARGAQPDSSKSGTQETIDKAGRTKDHEKEGGSTIDKVKDALHIGKK